MKLDWGEQEVFIGNGLGDTLNKMIDYHLKNNLKPELFINVHLRENRSLILDGYYIDWKRRMLVIQDVNYANTYRLLITINQLYINDLLTSMYGKDNKF